MSPGVHDFGEAIQPADLLAARLSYICLSYELGPLLPWLQVYPLLHSKNWCDRANFTFLIVYKVQPGSEFPNYKI
jgi:hypothetical protein